MLYAIRNKTDKTDNYYLSKDGASIVANTKAAMEYFAFSLEWLDWIEEYDENKDNSKALFHVCEYYEGALAEDEMKVLNGPIDLTIKEK